jgi:hypothetical protein
VDKKRFFCVRWLWENKKPFFIGLLWEKQVPIAVERTTCAVGSWDWVGANTSAKRSYFI